MGIDAVKWARKMEEYGAGENLLTSMNQDGQKTGYDWKLTRAVADAVTIRSSPRAAWGTWSTSTTACQGPGRCGPRARSSTSRNNYPAGEGVPEGARRAGKDCKKKGMTSGHALFENSLIQCDQPLVLPSHHPKSGQTGANSRIGGRLGNSRRTGSDRCGYISALSQKITIPVHELQFTRISGSAAKVRPDEEVAPLSICPTRRRNRSLPRTRSTDRRCCIGIIGSQAIGIRSGTGIRRNKISRSITASGQPLYERIPALRTMPVFSGEFSEAFVNASTFTIMLAMHCCSNPRLAS